MTPKPRSKRASLARLREMAFRHLDRCSASVAALHAVTKAIDRHPEAAQIWNVYDWLIAPYTLWPIDFVGLANHLAGRLQADRPLDSDSILLLRVLDRPPSAKTQSAIGDYEKIVSQGKYDSLVRQPKKFEETETLLRRDAALGALWDEIKQRFSTGNYGVGSRHVIRRSMSEERNFRPHLSFGWKTRKQKFGVIFDALCHRWTLYGFEGDKPLLLKISANPTPHGTMIVIPRHWSFDRARDLDWKAIGRLHKAHGARKQGEKLSENRLKRSAEVRLARQLVSQARAKGLRGERYMDYVRNGLKKDYRWDRTSLRRLLRG